MLLYYLIAAVVLAGISYVGKNKLLSYSAALLFVGCELGLNFYTITHIGQTEFEYFKIDHLAVLLTTISTIIALPAFYHSYIYLQRRNDSPAHQSLYISAMIMLLACMNMSYFAANLGFLWAFLEGTTICMSLLIYHERQRTTLEATWKYVFISSLAVAMAFIGILFLSIGITQNGETNLNIDHIISVAAQLNPLYLKISFVLLFIGFSGKLGVFPFHTINIDALAVAPSPVTALVGSALKGVGFVGLFRIYSIVAHTDTVEWANSVLLIAGLASVAVAAVELSKVKFFPRLLGYSSVEHLGIVLVCLSLGERGYFVALLHLVLHSFAKAGFYLQMGQVHDVYGSNRISKAGNYFQTFPLGALTALVGWLMVCALPPSGMFVTELQAFYNIFAQRSAWVGLLLLGLLTLIIYYSARYIFSLLFQPAEQESQVLTQNISPSESVSQWLLFALVFVLGFFPPDFLYEWINGAVSVMK